MCPWQTHVLRNVSHWAEIGFWCSINHKQCKTKDIYSVGEGKRNWADIMSHSVWIRLKTAIAEWTRQWVKLCFLDWQLQTERQKQGHCTCFWTTLKPLGLFVRLLFWRTGETDEKAEKSKHEWLQIMRNSDQAPYHLWHLRKREKKNPSIWQSCHPYPTCTAQLADQGTSYDSSATGFVFLSSRDQGSELPCYTPSCPLENEDRCFNGLKQFDLQVPLSPWLITPPALGLTPGIIDTLSTAGRGLRASNGLSFCIPQTITVLTGDKSLGDRINQRLHCAVHAPLAGLSCKFTEHRRCCCWDNIASSKSVGDNDICARCRKGNCLCGK